MGLQFNKNPYPSDASSRLHRTHKIFLLCNYALLGAAAICIFLTLSLRLLPSLCGLFLVLLHALTIAASVASAATAGSSAWYGAHLAVTVLTAVFQGSVAVLAFTRTGDFLRALDSYVREEDGAVILRFAGGLCVLIFVLEWVVLSLAFALRYYAAVEGGDSVAPAGGRSAKVGHDEDLKNWRPPFQAV